MFSWRASSSSTSSPSSWSPSQAPWCARFAGCYWGWACASVILPCSQKRIESTGSLSREKNQSRHQNLSAPHPSWSSHLFWSQYRCVYVCNTIYIHLAGAFIQNDLPDTWATYMLKMHTFFYSSRKFFSHNFVVLSHSHICCKTYSNSTYMGM